MPRFARTDVMFRTAPPRPCSIIARAAAWRRHDRAPDVELHDPVPRVARVRLGRMEHLARPAADGVDEDVDAPERVARRGDHPIGIRLAGRVPGRPRGPRTRRPGRAPRPASSVSWLRPVTTTRHPAPASASASADPMAPPPPATTATRPSRLKMSSCPIVLLRDLIDDRAYRRAGRSVNASAPSASRKKRITIDPTDASGEWT